MFAPMTNLKRHWQNIQEFDRVLSYPPGPEEFKAREVIRSTLLHMPTAHTPALLITRAAHIRAVRTCPSCLFICLTLVGRRSTSFEDGLLWPRAIRK